MQTCGGGCNRLKEPPVIELSETSSEQQHPASSQQGSDEEQIKGRACLSNTGRRGTKQRKEKKEDSVREAEVPERS